MSYFLYQGHQIYYEDIGKGKPVIFLHGNTASSKMFQFLLPLYSQYRVILIDFLGNGRSERLTSFPENVWIEWGKQTIALVEHIRTIEPHFRPSLIGTSGGAWAAINAALEVPEKIDKVVADSFDGRDHLDPSFAQSVIKEREDAKQDENAWQFYAWCQGEDWEQVVEQDTQALISCAEKQLPLFATSIERLKNPLLLTGSRADSMVFSGFEQEYRKLAKILPQVQIYLFDQGDHPSILTNAEGTAKIISEFLK